MKQQLKKTFLLFIIGVTFFNCNLEEDYVQKQNLNSKSERFKMQRKSFNELVVDKNISTLIKNYPRKEEVKNRIANRTISSGENDFYIDTEQSIYIEDNESNYSSYTFTIYRTETENTNYLENLVLSFPEDGYYQLTLIRYELTTQEKQDLENGLNINLSDNVITTTSIEDSELGAELSNKILLVQNGDCFTLIETSCSYGNHENGLSNGSNCPGYHEEEIWTFCNGSDGGGGSDTSGGDTSGGHDSGGGMDTGGGGGGTGTGGSDSSDPNDIGDSCRGCGGNIITSPLPELEEITADCNLILKLQADTNFKSRMSGLIEPARNWTREKVNVVNENSNPTSTNNYTYANFEGTVQSPTAEFTIYTNSAGYIHSHYNGLGSVFSAGDLQYLYQILKNNPAYFDDIFLGLVTASNTAYLLQIENRAAFIAFGDKYLADDKKINNFAKEKMYEKYNIHQDSSNETNENGFLKMMADFNMGISLASSHFNSSDSPSPNLFNSWTKLKWDTNSNQKSTSKCL